MPIGSISSITFSRIRLIRSRIHKKVGKVKSMGPLLSFKNQFRLKSVRNRIINKKFKGILKTSRRRNNKIKCLDKFMQKVSKKQR